MDAVIVAGGAGRRLGGVTKPTLPVAGRPMLRSVLAAVSASGTRVVVGPAALDPMLPPGVVRTQEQPPGGGPVAAIAAGLARLDADPRQPVAVDGFVALLAADLPLLTPSAVAQLTDALHTSDLDTDGAVYVDGDGRPQWLCGVWRSAALRRRLAAAEDLGPLAGRSLRAVLEPLRFVTVVGATGVPPPWYDCDTVEDLAVADRLARP